MSTRKLLTNGNAFKRTDSRWGGVVWYMDEQARTKKEELFRYNKSRSQQEDDGIYCGVQRLNN